MDSGSKTDEINLDTSTLPPHVAETVRAIALLHAEHTRKASLADRFADTCTALIGRPVSLLLLVLAICLWILSNLITGWSGTLPLDPPPFSWLELALTIAGILIAILILASQRRADRLAYLREQMNLETTLLTEQKVAKIIELIEELRRDSPNIVDRSDAEAQQMSTKTDPHKVLSAVETSANTHEQKLK